MAELTKADVEDMGYKNVRLLPDGTWAGTIELMFTRAICTNITPLSYSYRWCFEDRDRAVEELNKLEAMDDHPTGWIARR